MLPGLVTVVTRGSVLILICVGLVPTASKHVGVARVGPEPFPAAVARVTHSATTGGVWPVSTRVDPRIVGIVVTATTVVAATVFIAAVGAGLLAPWLNHTAPIRHPEMHATVILEDDYGTWGRAMNGSRSAIRVGVARAYPEVRAGGTDGNASAYDWRGAVVVMTCSVAAAGAETKHSEEDEEGVFYEVHGVGM